MKRTIQIQYPPVPPELTGDLSGGAWTKAAWHTNFIRLSQPDSEPRQRTSLAMVHDANRLYIAVRCQSPSGTSAEQIAREQVQIMLDPECAGQRTGLMVCQPNGLAHGKIVSDQTGDPWSGEIDYAASSGADGWNMVLAVPLSQLSHGDGSLRLMRFNVVRAPAIMDPESYLSFVRLPDTEFWAARNVVAEAEFERPELLAPFSWAVQRSGRAQFVERDGKPICRQGVKVANLSGHAAEMELGAVFAEQDLPPSVESRNRVRLGPGESRVETFELPLPVGCNFGFVQVGLREPDSGRCVAESRFVAESEALSWKEHFIKRGDGKGGYTCHPAQALLMPLYLGRKTCPFGLAEMDNGEIVFCGTAWPKQPGEPEQTLIAISGDGGATWGEYNALPGMHCRPMMLAYLGKGVVTFEAGENTGRFRLFSHDYGRTWTERAAVPPAPNGLPLGVEGNQLIERDAEGNAVRIAQTGQAVEGASPHWKITEYIRWSDDGMRTWPRSVCPEIWQRTETHAGKSYRFSAGEGSLVRAANGWLVAALRTWVPVRFLKHPRFGDSLEGTAVSISKDDGNTWSPLQVVFECGRHHAALVCMPNGDLVMTVIRRVDFRGDQMASYRRGCDAVVSRDNGLTWDVDHLYVLDDFPYCQGELWVNGECGHLWSTLLKDGYILTGYGNYVAGGTLIRWKP